MKINWGTGIAIFYTTFMVIMILFVIKSREVDHSLVVDNYYEKDIGYQSHMNKLENTRALAQDLVIQQSQGSVQFQFPKEFAGAEGEIQFYRPSDSSKDVFVQIEPDSENNVSVKTADLIPGLWRVKVEWKAAGKDYYKEQVITI